MSYMKNVYYTGETEICPGCGELDPTCKWEDFGIGTYEYWGFVGVDRHLEWVTRCCEARPEQFWPEPEQVIYEHDLV